MAAILDKYAIKEVADVMFYELDSKGAPSAPVLYIDTAKVTTISQSAETVDARGGKSNIKLLSWDTNKELTMELTDALFSAKSLGIMFGGVMHDNGNTQEVLKTLRPHEIQTVGESSSSTSGYWKFNIKDVDYAISKTKCTYFKYRTGETDPTPMAYANASDAEALTGFDFITFDLLDCTKCVDGYAVARTVTGNGTTDNGVVKNGITIDITANFNANTYYITGDTYARNYQNGQDEFLQFIIPKGKVSAEDVSLTMEADGDPAEFTMNVQCLKAADGSMLKLVKYTLGEYEGDDSVPNKGVASVLDHYNGDNQHALWSTTPYAASKALESLNEGAAANWSDEG